MNVGYLISTKEGIIGRVKNVNKDGSVTVKYRERQGKWVGKYQPSDLEVLAVAGHNICKECGKSFKAKKGNEQYCTKRCQGFTYKCTLCGKAGKAKTATAKYCESCKTKNVNKRQKEKYARENSSGVEISESETVVGNYKEPLRKVISGYGYLGALTYSKDRDLVQCHLCGKFFKSVSAHARQSHKISTEDYKKMFEIAYATPLIGDATKEKLIKVYDASKLRYLRQWQKSDKNKERRVKRNRERKGSRLPLEIRNKRGNCPDQLLDMIKKLKDKLGRVPSVKDFKKEYNEKHTGTIYYTYGSWTKACELAGFESIKSEQNEKYSKKKLLEYLRLFYKKHNRSPRHADFGRGILPSRQPYRTQFEKLNFARFEAGIPLVIETSAFRFIETMEYDKYPDETGIY